MISTTDTFSTKNSHKHTNGLCRLMKKSRTNTTMPNPLKFHSVKQSDYLRTHLIYTIFHWSNKG